MGKWTREKVNSENLNGGNQYEAKDRLSREQLNAMVNSGLYAQDFAEHLADTPDTSEANNVGVPTVELIDNGKFKKFKFSNLKGQKGDKGDKGDRGESGEIYQTTGTSRTGSMSQDAITNELNTLNDKIITLDKIYPIGSIYMSTSPTNPQELFGGKWEAFGQGRTIIGAGTSDQAFTAGTTGGASTHTLTINEMPSHTHIQNEHAHKFNRGVQHEYSSNVINGYSTTARYLGFVEQAGGGGDSYQYTAGSGKYVANPEVATNQNTGGGAPYNTLPPYIVTYMWTRTA